VYLTSLGCVLMQTKVAKDTPRPGDPMFIANEQAGWSENAGRWLDKGGKFSTRNKVLSSNTQRGSQGGFVKFNAPTPITSNFEILEMSAFNGETESPMSGIGGVLNALVNSGTAYRARMSASYEAGVKLWEKHRANKMMGVQGFDKTPEDKPLANFMPVQIQTRLAIAEQYYNNDGDAANVVDVPVELLSRKIDVTCTDTRLRQEIEQFLLDKKLEAIISELWSTMREYGQSYPYEVWDDPDNPKDLINIIPLPPKSVHVGYYWSYALGADYAGAVTWTESLMNSVFPPAMFKILQRHWNDSPMYEIPASGVPLSGDFLVPLFDKKRSWARYSNPMIMRGIRELVDRTVYQDSVRALVEGFRYQLWVIKLGDADHVPQPEEIAAVKQMVTDMSGDRTGMLVWRDAPFTVEVHAPKGLQEMISNDYYGGMTKEFMRKMGITSQVVDGETPGTLGSSGGRGAAADKGDINVQLFYERARYQSKQILDWLTYLIKKWVRYNTAGKKLSIKALDSLSLDFAPTYVEIAGRVSEIYGPMYRDGALSHHTYTAAAGLRGDVELEYKRNELPARDEGLLNPPVTYAQMVVNAQGDTKQVSQTEPQGSPDAAEEQNNKLARENTGGKDRAALVAEAISQPQPVINVYNQQSPAAPPSVMIAASPAPDVSVNVTMPEQQPAIVNAPITVEAQRPAEIRLEPRFNVLPAAVHVSQPDVYVTNTVEMPKQEAPIVNVAATEVHVEQPDINITNPITVEAAQIIVPETPPAQVIVQSAAPEVHVHVPEQPAPIINVAAPDVTVENNVSPTPVNITNEIVTPAREKKKVEFEYDRDGNIVGAKEA
jgi:hypothetical protein